MQVADAVLCGFNCLGDAAGESNVVVLDEHAVVESHAMVLAAADRNSVLFEHPKPGCRLTRIDDLSVGTLDRFHILTCQCRNTRHPLHEIESSAFTDEQYISITLQGRENGTVLDLITLAERRLDLAALRIQMKEHRLGNIDPAQNDILFCQETAVAARVGRNRGCRRDVTAPNVLSEKLTDTRQHLAILKPIHYLFMSLPGVNTSQYWMISDEFNLKPRQYKVVYAHSP